jgi:glycosyltransferase involved in cell wall biosynthesis
MRLLVLVPDLVLSAPMRALGDFLLSRRRLEKFAIKHRLMVHPRLRTHVAWGGTLNNMRHCAIARSLGVDACLVSPSGRDTYGKFNVATLPYVSWKDRRDDDVILIPDFCTELADDVVGKTIVYLQVPIHLEQNFRHRRDNVVLWTDSPFMLEKCQAVFPNKEIRIVPNIIDDQAFPFIPQAEREPGLLMAFPRKGPDYIESTRKHYAALGGKHWRFELIDGIPLQELAMRMRRPQVFLASAEIEGCALPPQECMAAGIVVVGRSARGANFSMEHRETAMIAETPEAAAQCLIDLEQAELREQIALRAHAFISRYFAGNEPTAFWRETLTDFGFSLRQ